MPHLYTFVCLSKEQRGATKPNIVQIALGGDDQALIMADNIQVLYSVLVKSVSKVVREGARPTDGYVQGTGNVVRSAVWDANDRTVNIKFRSVKDSFAPIAFSNALLEAGIQTYPGDNATAVTSTMIETNKIPRPTVQ